MRNWCIVLLLMCCVSVGAQQIVDRSAKKRPEWYGTTRQGFLVVTGVDSDLQKAQQKTLNEVKLQILQSVAQNVTYSNEMMTELLTQNQDVQTTTSFREQGTTRVANLPFLTGIALSRAADSYWELQRDKQSGEMQYAFCLLYPYSDADYQELKAQFDELEGRMEKVVSDAEAAKDNIADAETIGETVDKLTTAYNYFIDGRRRSWTKQTIEAYNALYSQMAIKTEKIGRAKYLCRLTLGGSKINCSTQPKFRSECASDLKCESADGEFILTFDDSDCIADEPNSISITLRLDGHLIKSQLRIDR
jgi:hypothetical protein